MKSKIEEKIEKAREATNEMFAAFDELNEMLSEKLQPEFKVGDYLTMANIEGDIFLGILRYKLRRGNGGFRYYAGINRESEFATYDAFGFQDDSKIDFSTPEEIALLDSKLAEQGKRFDKEKLELVGIPKFKVGDWFIPHKPKENKTDTNWATEMDKFDGVILQVSKPKYDCTENLYSEVVDWHFHPDWCEKVNEPKHKEPIIGEMAIFWDTDNKKAFCATLNSIINGRYSPDGNIRFDKAILYESPEQYKSFVKEKLELVDIPKHKEPIIGEMEIFWDNDKCNAACKILDDDSGAFFIDNSETYWINAILFESPKQYKAFLKS